MQKRIVARAAALVGAGALTATMGAVVTSPSQAEPSRLCATTAPIRATDLAAGLRAGCSLEGREVRHGAFSLQVPAEGQSVTFHALVAEGQPHAEEFVLSNKGGVVKAEFEAHDEHAEEAAAETAAARCPWGDYALISGARWRSKNQWRYSFKTTPRRMTSTAAYRAIWSGFVNMRDTRNNCGLRRKPRVPVSYMGLTGKRSQISARNGQVNCGGVNRYDRVDWGALPSGVLGVTCVWWNSKKAFVAADMRFTTRHPLIPRVSRSCTRGYDLQSVSTHEFGHWFGLGHARNVRQTMYPSVGPCKTAYRTVGKGDWRGLRALYGLR